MKRFFQISIILVLAISGTFTYGQAKLKAANRQFEDFSYLNAIPLYEGYLKEKNVEQPARQEALKKLAYSYRRIQDIRNAERVYADLIRDYPDTESENYLYYAQSLAGNGKYRESQKIYSKYGERQAADLRGKRFTVSYMDMSRFYRDSSTYKITYLPINSRQADFSPMYYKGGLVFCSAREESGAIKKVFSWNQTPFLDLYFVADTAELRVQRGVPGASALGGMSASNSDNAVASIQPLTKVEEFSRILNTKYHEGPMSFFKGEQKVIFTRNNYNKGKTRESKDGVNKLKLFSGDLVNNAWSNIKELPFNSDEYSVGHPALSPDNTKLYFVSDMPGGYGGTDIYVVEYNNGTWGSPVNLGKEINTEGNEMFPFADENGNLYFASDGHEGLGGLDIFYAEMKDEVAYRGVVNLGAPINSEKDDFGLITDGNRNSGFFSSNRKMGVHDDNIYSFAKSCREMELIVYDAASKTPLENVDVRTIVNGENRDLRVTGIEGSTKMCLQSESEYEFKAIKEGYQTNSVVFSTKSNSAQKTQLALYLDKSTGTLLRGVVKSEVNQQPLSGVQVTLQNEKDNTKQTVVTGADGAYEFDVKPNANHKLTAQKDKYATTKEAFDKFKSGKSNKQFQADLAMYGEGDIFKLNNIYYDYGKFFIRTDAAKELDSRLIPLLKKYPEMKIEIRSHTDARSSDTYNMQLSDNRARAVVDYLVARGVDPARLVSKGYGETEPINECVDGVQCTELDYKQNRRTEFRILAVK
ncbi:WD40-like Beta Propeller Repeat [Pseudarcicella hirudinis]|uniref:WD40-like Beta Propeller Repeat n=1 Tax=Pseudarcicella hirudinis TaxID=1079859 RepID=A0A1I5P1S4_9BACT|nr:OmpA family protein [Pseudarcicella hirudinis]SFP27999.1 WD40-like Beta Propeller Repeat [Pseudarcicella hirudinis]